MSNLKYTQHKVAFPRLPVTPSQDWVKDSLGIHDDENGGEFYWEFLEFNSGHRGVRLSVFGDGLQLFMNETVQRLFKWWREQKDPDVVTPDQFIRQCEKLGIEASSYHKRGLAA